jgi:hypothetical protein
MKKYISILVFLIPLLCNAQFNFIDSVSITEDLTTVNFYVREQVNIGVKHKRITVFERNDSVLGNTFVVIAKNVPAATYSLDTAFTFQKQAGKKYCAYLLRCFADTNTIDTSVYKYSDTMVQYDTFLKVTNNCYPLAISEFNKPLMYFSNQYLCSNATIQKIIISNLYGQMVYKSTNDHFPLRLPLMSGVYLVHYWVDDKRYVMKIQAE